jgi:hypothetical protein
LGDIPWREGHRDWGDIAEPKDERDEGRPAEGYEVLRGHIYRHFKGGYFILTSATRLPASYAADILAEAGFATSVPFFYNCRRALDT